MFLAEKKPMLKNPQGLILNNMLRECDFGKEVILMGDFNIKYDDKSCRKTLKRITNTFDLTQLVKGPTRVTCCSKTQIDHSIWLLGYMNII